jgi:hypothetical protein
LSTVFAVPELDDGATAVVPPPSRAAYVAAPVPAAMTRAAAPAVILVSERFIVILSGGCRFPWHHPALGTLCEPPVNRL